MSNRNAVTDDVDERPVVNRIADLIRSGAAVGTTATDTAREIWACLEMTGQLAAPSSVQGDTTPRDDFDAIAAAEYRATSAPSETGDDRG